MLTNKLITSHEAFETGSYINYKKNKATVIDCNKSKYGDSYILRIVIHTDRPI
ncbi:hypothetical protein [Macrococcoides canis]|uniref:hypothetical protein n=1 Tax=Macrococcoides canis TaxID=1855823 RepID=UPI001409AE50|nr:hypothetical protein [Macrococcus canis]